MTKFHAEFPSLCRIWKHMNNATHWIAIGSKTVAGAYGSSSIQFYSRWMISQISSVSFLVYTLLCVESWSTDSWEFGHKTGVVLGDIRRCKNITVCDANVHLPEVAKFKNFIFAHLHDAPCTVPPGADSSLYYLPHSRCHWITSVTCSLVFIGFACHSELPLRWRCWHTAYCMALQCPT